MTYIMEDKDKKHFVRRPVLKKINTENLLLIERGLLGDLPDRLKPYTGPVRGQSTEIAVAKASGFLSSCLPVIPDSPGSEKLTSSDDEKVSPLKKSFSFRDRFSRISFLGKKERPDKLKWKTIVEDDTNKCDTSKAPQHRPQSETPPGHDSVEHDYKSSKRFWFFRNKDLMEKKENNRPVYKRSKSFEFLPKAIDEEEEKKEKKLVKNLSYVFGSNDTMGDAWTSNESLEYISNVYYDNDDTIYLKSIRELSTDSSMNNSSLSTVTSASSGIVANIFNRESVQNLLDEFDKAVELFSETYLSDCEPYTKSAKVNDTEKREKRKSSSFSTLPSPKVLQAAKPSEVSEDFKEELSQMLSAKRASEVPLMSSVRSARRGSVTDWFVLEDQAAAAVAAAEQNKYRRAQKKPMNRVRRMSSTKYMPFKIVQTTERGANKLFIVPSGWENQGQVRYPKKPNESALVKNDYGTT